MLVKEGKTNWKYILIIVILAAIICGGILTWQYFETREETKLPEEKTSEETAKDETADWKTYRNEEYGYEVKYPTDYIANTDNPTRVYFKPSEFTFIEGSFPTIEIIDKSPEEQKESLKQQYLIPKSPFAEIIEREDIIVNNLRGEDMIFMAETGVETRYILLFYKNRTYQLKADYVLKIQTVFNQMLSTFKFIEVDETADWEIYGNEEYGFEIKYPKELMVVEERDHFGWFDEGRFKAKFRHSQEESVGGDISVAIIENEENLSLEKYFENIKERYLQNNGGHVRYFPFADLKPREISTIDGYTSYQFIIPDVLGTLDTIFSYKKYIFRIGIVLTPTKVYTMEERLEIFNQMLSTFRFFNDEDVGDVETEEKEFGIFGDSEFYTVISGYLEIREKEYFEGSTITTAYFVITKFYDDEFRESVDEGINQGNGVNIKENGLYKFNLGCFEGGEIIGIEHEEDKIYIDEETTEKIINSSKENHVSIVLFFGKHLGSGCTCCNLAHQVRIYDEEN